MAPAIVRKAPYKDFLQPALHRRFSSTATILLALSYLQAIFLSGWGSCEYPLPCKLRSSWLTLLDFWTWFPIGPAGIRTLFLFICGLAIIVLRISQYHIGVRASNSTFHAFTKYFFSIQTVETWIFYGFSSTLFAFIYIWAVPETANLGLITYHSGDRARLNERALFFFCYMAVSAVVQSLFHFHYDEDKIIIDVSRRENGDPKSTGDTSATLKNVVSEIPAILSQAVQRALTDILVCFLAYFLFLRSWTWGWALVFLRPFYNLPKTNMLPPGQPADVYLVWRCFSAGFLLYSIWKTANHAFSTFMVKEPLKNGKPLTSESKDPNGSLLSGLKSKKSQIRCFALWELAYIARNDPARRKAIYEDIDRKDGSTWSQIHLLCLDVVKSMEKRIDDYGKPVAVPPQPAAPEEIRNRSSVPLKEDAIFQSKPANKTMRGEVEKALSSVGRHPGHSPVSQLSPSAKKMLRGARDKVLSKEQQEALSSPQIKSQFQTWALKVVSSEPCGRVFRQDFRKRLTAVILGTPYSELSQYVNATEVLSLFLVNSLQEDKFGNVHRDVANVIRAFTTIIAKIEAFKANFPIHWTDIEQKKDTPEVDAVIDALKTGLAQVVAEFEPYSSDLRLSRADIRLAKEAAAKQPRALPEMQQTS
ncbi:nuclear envelope protein [Colletotrichum sojae]|uniref:Nuclear envelope protein n=1 Tax=Colletotrichum sojae TaxID=2175907 RepID=A0A8H6JQE2_9PEZI|nr:nuclear envelope protein [Colletotrichum sojae]